MTKVGLVQLGCAKNQVDGEEILGALSSAPGCRFVADKADADVLIVNTCAFIEAAREESVNAILEAVKLKGQGRVSKVVVTGCLAQRYGDELAKEIPEVDAFLGIESAKGISNVVFGPAPARRNLVQPSVDPYPLVPLARARTGETPWSAYLKVSEGCDHACTFCSIPSFRGKHRSKSVERLVEEARQLVESGVVELNLVAQDTTAYGMDLYKRLALPDLLQELAKIEGLRWIRLLYCYPTMISQDLIDTIAAQGKVLPYIDMPLQHADDTVLRAMKRSGDRDRYSRLIARLRDRIPGLALRTTFIVGFPGETQSQFETLLEFVKQTEFDRLGVFVYSLEENTPSYLFGSRVPKSVAQTRKELILQAQQEISKRRGESMVGSVVDVLVERSNGNHASGRCFRDAPEIDGIVEVKGTTALPGSIVKARIVSAGEYDLRAVEVLHTSPLLLS